MTHTYRINGMTCSSCVARVKNELLKLGDILEAEVQLPFPQAVITMSKHIGAGQLQAAVSKAGKYTITEVHSSNSMAHEEKPAGTKNSYYPIVLIFGYIAVVSLLVQLISGYFNMEQWMSHFMAGFFLVFSFFKLLNIQGFADGYSSYDIVARIFPAWGFTYPFVELSLGLLFLTGTFSLGTNIVTLVVMGVSSIGVIQSLVKKSPFQCACLGSIIQLPLSKVTLFEDLLMVVMSSMMIIKLLN